MRLWELATPHEVLGEAYYAAEDDTLGSRHVSDVRKKTLTLKDLNKLKVVRAMRKYDALKKADLIAVMYGSQSSEEALAEIDIKTQRVALARARLELRGKADEIATKRNAVIDKRKARVAVLAMAGAASEVRKRKNR